MSNFHVNSFQVPNALVDKLMNEMSGNALKCLMYIIRQTRGWNKQYDSIAASKFVEACGISKNTALGALEELVSLGLIRKDKSERSTGLNTYSLTSMFDAGVVHDTGANSEPVSSAKIALVQNLNRADSEPASANSELVTSANSAPTKDILFKNTIQKTNTPAKPKAERSKAKTSIPSNFGISEAVRKWAKENGHNQLDTRLEHFTGYVIANGKTYANWDQAFQNAIRDDWAKLNNTKAANQAPHAKTQTPIKSEQQGFDGPALFIFKGLQQGNPNLTEKDVRYLAHQNNRLPIEQLYEMEREAKAGAA